MHNTNDFRTQRKIIDKAIVLIGVGSTYFTKGIVEGMRRIKCELRLCDIDENCLDIAMKLSQKMADEYQANILIKGSTDRRRLLSGAHAVVPIGVGGRKAWAKDVFMFHEFGIYQSTGDTYGAGGISRALRTIPVMIGIARDMELLCPDALLINFTNPMGPIISGSVSGDLDQVCRAVLRGDLVPYMLADFIGVSFSETWSKAVGANHFTWITDFEYQGQNAWPLVHDAMLRKKERMTWSGTSLIPGSFSDIWRVSVCR